MGLRIVRNRTVRARALKCRPEASPVSQTSPSPVPPRRCTTPCRGRIYQDVQSNVTLGCRYGIWQYSGPRDGDPFGGSSDGVALSGTRRRKSVEGELAGLAPHARGPKAKPIDPRDKKLVEAWRDVARLQALQETRFVDLAPGQVYATLLNEERYQCSERTFYRVLAANAEVREWRNQLRHPRYAAPELLATRPNELWSWDITKLLGPTQ